MSVSLKIRQSNDNDRLAICDLIRAAFGEAEGQDVADLTMELLDDPSAQPLLSLVMTDDEKIVGHVLFTKTRIEDSRPSVESAILAPLAVHPAYQKRGIGGQLTEEGLKQLKQSGVALVFVLGHPGYYPKFGFVEAGKAGLEAPYPIPPEHAAAWMVQELVPGTVGQVKGKVICADALDKPEHWRE